MLLLTFHNMMKNEAQDKRAKTKRYSLYAQIHSESRAVSPRSHLPLPAAVHTHSSVPEIQQDWEVQNAERLVFRDGSN